MDLATEKFPLDLGEIAVFNPRKYLLEGRFFDFNSTYSFPEESPFSAGELNLVIPDTELEYPGLQKSFMYLKVGTRETIALKETGQKETNEDVNFFKYDSKGTHAWRCRKSGQLREDNSENLPKFNFDQNFWKVYSLEKVLKETVKTTPFSEDLEETSFISWLRNPNLTNPNQLKYSSFHLKNKTAHPLYSALFSNNCAFVFPKEGSNSEERFLEIRLYRSITDEKTEPFLSSPLEIMLIEIINGEARFIDYYIANEEQLVYHEWEGARIHANGSVEDFPHLKGFKNGDSVDPTKLFRYGNAIMDMLQINELDSILTAHPILQRLKSNDLWNLPVYSNLVSTTDDQKKSDLIKAA